MSVEKCIVKRTLWANTDNKYQPIQEYTFPSYEAAMSYVATLKSYLFAYMHRIDVNLTIEGL